MNTHGLRQSLETSELPDRAFEDLKAKLQRFDPSKEDARAFYKFSVLTWTEALTAGEAAQLAPLVKEKLGIPRDALERDLRDRRRQREATEEANGSDPKSKRPSHWPDRPIHQALDFDPASEFTCMGLHRKKVYGVISYRPDVGAAWHSIETVRDQIISMPFQYNKLADRWPEEDLRRFLTISSPQGFSGPAALLIDLLDSLLEMRREYFSLETSFVIGTYFFPLFDSFPRLHHNAEAGSGKTKVQRLISETAFNGLLRIEARPANLFRIIEAHRATICLDEIESITGEDRKDLLAILNSGYQKGGSVDRTEGDKEKRVVPFDVYAPISFSGIKGINRTTAERCIVVLMQRGLDRQKVNRNFRTAENQIKQVRALLCRLCLTRSADVLKTYSTLTFPSWLNGRARELWGPLLTIATLIDQESDLELVKDLEILAKEGVIDAEGLSSEAEALLEILRIELEKGDFCIVRPGDLCDRLDSDLKPRYPFSPEAVGMILRRLGFKRMGRDRGGAKYEITREAVAKIRARYLPPEEGVAGGETTVTPSPSPGPSHATN